MLSMVDFRVCQRNMTRHYLTPLLLTLCLILSSGCATMTTLGGQVRSTLEPPLARADALVGIAKQKADSLDAIGAKVSTGQPLTVEEQMELAELINTISTPIGVAKESTENALWMIRLLPEKK